MFTLPRGGGCAVITRGFWTARFATQTRRRSRRVHGLPVRRGAPSPVVSGKVLAMVSTVHDGLLDAEPCDPPCVRPLFRLLSAKL